MIVERGAGINSAKWPARRVAHRTIRATVLPAQWISGKRAVAAPTCVVGTQRFACPSTPLAADVDKPWAPPGSALRTQSVLNVSVF
ncbi:hypothetical protein BTK88_004454 [Burkholderia pyrrocinia]|nr:hypothetical protein [Burkholderia pyrrocinia]